MKINIKLTLNFRDDDSGGPDGPPAFQIKMQNADGDWWLVDALRWSDRHRDGMVFTDRTVAEKALGLLKEADVHHGRTARRFSLIEFKKGGI